MSVTYIETIRDIVAQFRMDDERLEQRGNCRNAAQIIRNELTGLYPDLAVHYLAYPDAGPGPEVHYAIGIGSRGNEIVINTVAASGFPDFIGPKDGAPGKLSKMTIVDQII